MLNIKTARKLVEKLSHDGQVVRFDDKNDPEEIYCEIRDLEDFGVTKTTMLHHGVLLDDIYFRSAEMKYGQNRPVLTTIITDFEE